MIELTQAAAATVRDPLVVTLFGFVSADCYRISCFAAIHAHTAGSAALSVLLHSPADHSEF